MALEKSENSVKKDKRKIWIVLGIGAVLVIALAIALFFAPKNSGSAILDLSDTTVLTYTDLEKSISGTGIVESQKSTTVYSSLAYAVKAVNVEVGDYVEEGQLLAELDDQNILDQIASQEISIQTGANSSNQQINSAQNNYDNFKEGIDEGLNASLNSAENQVDAAWENYKKAKNTYERYKETLDLDQNASLINAETALKAAEKALEGVETVYDSAKADYEKAETALAPKKAAYDSAVQKENEIKAAVTALESEKSALVAQYEAATDESIKAELQSQISAKESEISAKNTELALAEQTTAAAKPDYDLALAEEQKAAASLSAAKAQFDEAKESYNNQLSIYNAAVRTVDQTLADYHHNVKTAWDNYQNALTSLEITEKTVEEQLENYKTALENAKENAHNALGEESLRQLRVDLESTKITAPCSGTVTAVYAKVGAGGSGLLFVIEDVDKLLVETSIKGYDIGKLLPGIKVEVTSEATEGQDIEGVLSFVAPTANKNSQGVTNVGTEALFAAEVEVITENTGLKIGMEADLDFIIESKNSVLAVPYDAVYKNGDGKTCVIAAEEQKDGTYLLKELEVTVGMDDDLDIAVSGDGVTEGLRILNEPENYIGLIGQKIKTGTISNFPFPVQP